MGAGEAASLYFVVRSCRGTEILEGCWAMSSSPCAEVAYSICHVDQHNVGTGPGLAGAGTDENSSTLFLSTIPLS